MPVDIGFPEQPRSHARRGRRALYWLVSIALAAALLTFSLRGIEWGRVGVLLRGARLTLVGVVFCLGTVVLFLRSVRWWILLRAEGEVAILSAFWATAAGYLGNNFLPARTGELVRTFVVTQGTGLSKTFVLTTALLERVADALVLSGISAAALLTMGSSMRPGWLANASRPFGLLALGGMLAITIIPWTEPFWLRALARLPVPEPLLRRSESVLRHVVAGIRSFHDPARLAKFFGLTLTIWLLDGLGAVLGGRALGLNITLPVALLLNAGLGLGSALPSTPGYVGVYQFVAVTVLTPFGIRRTDAIAYILLAQALQYLQMLIWGLIGIVKYRKARANPAVANTETPAKPGLV